MDENLYVRKNPMDHQKAYEDKLGDNLFYCESFPTLKTQVPARFSTFALNSFIYGGNEEQRTTSRNCAPCSIFRKNDNGKKLFSSCNVTT